MTELRIINRRILILKNNVEVEYRKDYRQGGVTSDGFLFSLASEGSDANCWNKFVPIVDVPDLIKFMKETK